MSITFYDIPFNVPNKGWSPNTLKTRFALNFKGLKFQTVWVEYPDIEGVCKKIGAPPTDGGKYTLPVIKDDSTGAIVSDSFLIALYLEKTYPSKPSLFPGGTYALQNIFQDAYTGTLDGWWLPVLYASFTVLNEGSVEYFRTTREKTFGIKMEEFSPAGSSTRAEHFKQIAAGFNTLNSWLETNPKGKYVLGETPSYADLTIASFLKWFEIVLPADWKQVAALNGGRWGAFLKDFDKYSA